MIRLGEKLETLVLIYGSWYVFMNIAKVIDYKDYLALAVAMSYQLLQD